MVSRPRICLIDDDIYVRDAMALGLADSGFDVVTAPGAAAGFDIARRQHVDVIVTDMKMPGTDGARFIADIRANWPDMPIVAISGAAAIGDRSTDDVAKEFGADAALIKPFRARELAAALERVLAARQPRA